jgi:UDP-N-acetylmuramyl pentapeptide phosphotransferase/UDP-N-acetylglucosamine-1-phosphate transferase
LSFALSWLLTSRLRVYLLAKGVLDIPNERSSHAVPIPRGAGLAVIMTIILGLLVSSAEALNLSTLLILLSLTLLLAVSWIDDKRSLSPTLRLGIHLLAATIGSFALGERATLFGDTLPFLVDRVLMIIGWAWFMNLYNFMDGVDGITGSQTVCCTAGVFLLLASVAPEQAATSQNLCALMIGSCLGFLMLNWHPAKIFLGDSGSVPLGFLVAFLLLKLATLDVAYLLPAFLIPLFYIADSGITLTKRALRKEKIWQAHRQHYYQGATAGEGTPVPIVLWLIIANIGLISCAFLSIKSPWLGAGLGVGILLLLLAKMSHSARKVHRK